MEVKNITDVQRIFNEEKPKHVCLLDGAGSAVVHWNNPQIPVKKRFDEILKKLSSNNTPDGIYYFVYKDALGKNAVENRTAVGKGNYPSTAPMLRDKPSVQVTSPAESVWSVSQALDILTERNSLRLEVAALTKENKELSEYVEKLESKLPNDEGKSASGMVSELKELVETFSPVIDKYFAQEDKRLQLAERKAVEVKPATRTDGGVNFDSTDYPLYFHSIVNGDDGELLDYELELMEKFNPAMYQTYVAHYKLTEEQAPENG